MSTMRRSPYMPMAQNMGSVNNGDHLTQREFHARYELMPSEYRAELLNGVVYVCEPLGLEHSEADAHLIALIAAYSAGTPGLAVHQNATVILGPKDEVQPDLFLRVRPEYGGQSGILKGKKASFAKGAPEFVAEVANSSRAMDLHLKKERYMRAGVQDYLVVCLDPLELYWFDLPNGKRLKPSDQGVLISPVFPGLWVHEQALLKNDYRQMMDVLNQGLQTLEHEQFVMKLASRRLDKRQ